MPDGYKYAEEITFEVGKDGKVQTVTMKDAPSKLTVSKKDHGRSYQRIFREQPSRYRMRTVMS